MKSKGEIQGNHKRLKQLTVSVRFDKRDRLMTSPDCRKQKFLNRSSAIRNDNREVIKSESHPVHVPILQPHGYTVHGILQVRILEWVAFPFFGGSSQPRDQTQVSCIAGRLFTS